MPKKVIEGNVNLNLLHLEELPDFLSDVEVNGDFECGYNQLLTTLKGSPKRVNGGFFCYFNALTSLEGAPSYVSGNFICTTNQLTSLKGAPEYVGGSFGCGDNRLTSLEGAPKYVGGDFHCYDNTVKFTEEQVRAVCEVGGDVYV